MINSMIYTFFADGQGMNFLDLAGGDEVLAKQLKASRIVDDMLEQRWTPFEVKMMTKEKVVGVVLYEHVCKCANS